MDSNTVVLTPHQGWGSSLAMEEPYWQEKEKLENQNT